MPQNPLPEKLAAKAELIVNSLKETEYLHDESIDTAAGIYLCDCNGFVGFILETLAPAHYALIPKEATQPRPRAFEYRDFFNGLPQPSAGPWRRIHALADARRGDILAWRFPQIQVGHDTGHVMILAEMPNLTDSGDYTVRIYDSADQPHFNDTRGPDDNQFPNGVGSGVINFQVDDEGQPTAFLFAPGDEFVTLAIAIGRPEPASVT